MGDRPDMFSPYHEGTFPKEGKSRETNSDKIAAKKSEQAYAMVDENRERELSEESLGKLKDLAETPDKVELSSQNPGHFVDGQVEQYASQPHEAGNEKQSGLDDDELTADGQNRRDLLKAAAAMGVASLLGVSLASGGMKNAERQEKADDEAEDQYEIERQAAETEKQGIDLAVAKNKEYANNLLKERGYSPMEIDQIFNDGLSDIVGDKSKSRFEILEYLHGEGMLTD